MKVDYLNQTGLSRKDSLILKTFGKDILDLLSDPDVNEVYVNDDYYVRINGTYGRKKTTILLPDVKVKGICEAIAGYNDQIISTEKPHLGVELSTLRIRSELEYPPVARKPVFFLRKKPERIYSLENYVESGTLSNHYYDYIKTLITERKNVLVIGATGSGKTTFLNAVLKKLAELCPEDRLVILEDVAELECSSDDHQHFFTSGNRSTKVLLDDLVRICMRVSPTRIVIGEVRDKGAYDVCKAWKTGHSGGYCTIHADNTEDALLRLELLAKEHESANNTEDVRELIGKSIHAVISIQRFTSATGTYRKVEDILEVKGYDRSQKQFICCHV